MDIQTHKKSFGSIAKDYTKYRQPYPKKVFQKFFSLIKVKPKIILDLACGTGKSTESLVRKGVDVHGIDHDPNMIKEARVQARLKGLPIKYAVADAEALTFPAETFDAISVGTAFHWFANKNAINNISRILKPDGLLFIYWTLTTKDVLDENSIPNTFLKRYSWDRVPSKLRALDYIQSFLKKNSYSNVGTIRIPIKFKSTVDEVVGLMKTASAYSVLSKQEKNTFVKDLTKIMTEKLGKRKFFPFEEEIQICFGYKKK